MGMLGINTECLAHMHEALGSIFSLTLNPGYGGIYLHNLNTCPKAQAERSAAWIYDEGRNTGISCLIWLFWILDSVLAILLLSLRRYPVPRQSLQRVLTKLAQDSLSLPSTCEDSGEQKVGSHQTTSSVTLISGLSLQDLKKKKSLLFLGTTQLMTRLQSPHRPGQFLDKRCSRFSPWC